MTPALLRDAGVALYGPRWQSDLARDLDVADRTVRRWLVGYTPIPDALAGEVRAMLAKRRLELAEVMQRLPR